LFPKARKSGAAAINDKDQVVGYMEVDREIEHAFLWEAGQVTDLGTLSGGSSCAADINARGQIVGYSDFGVRSLHGFLWENGKMRDLGTLGGRTTEARGINDSAQVVGVSETAPWQYHAFLWEKGVIHDLGSPGPGLCTAAKINNKGTVVGDWWPEKTSYKGARALVWIDRKMYDLNDLIPNGSGWVLEAAIAINDKGEIVGKGKHNGDERAFLLTPVPKVAP
jgi:probable HAF family extracellular repeat protein